MQPALVTVLAFVLMMTAALPAAAQGLSVAGVALLERWNKAVHDHAPGKPDDAVEQVMTITYEDRLLLENPMRVFRSVLSGQRYDPNGELQQKVYILALASRTRFGYAPFLKRAVILHTDAGIAGESDRPAPLDPRTLRNAPSSPLFDTRPMTLNRDGEIRGDVESNWNWPFARSLVASLHAFAASDKFTADWYHATTAFMYEHLSYAEAVAHLDAAAKILPDDARILFDRGTLAEVQSLPMTQVLMRGIDLVAFKQMREGRRLAGTTSDATRSAVALGLPLKVEALDEAERHFRRALKVDPSLIEARVRLGHVLIERERYGDAEAELRTALSGGPSGEVAFYAHLFAGRAAQALGKYADAARHVDEARRLFPDAQSALLAQSQIALLRADLNGAVGPIERLPKDPVREDLSNDPWASYRNAIGREWAALYRSLVERK